MGKVYVLINGNIFRSAKELRRHVKHIVKFADTFEHPCDTFSFIYQLIDRRPEPALFAVLSISHDENYFIVRHKDSTITRISIEECIKGATSPKKNQYMKMEKN